MPTVVVTAHRERRQQLWLRYGAWRENGEERGTKIFQAFLGAEVFQQLKKQSNITLCSTVMDGPVKIIRYFRQSEKAAKNNYSFGSFPVAVESSTTFDRLSQNHQN
jgi:hypothetical protein